MVGTVRSFLPLCVDDQGRCLFRHRPGCSGGEKRWAGIGSGRRLPRSRRRPPRRQRLGNGLEVVSGTIIEARAKACCDLRLLRALKCLFEFERLFAQ